MAWSFYCPTCLEVFIFPDKETVLDSPDPSGSCSECGLDGCVQCLKGSLCDFCHDAMLRDRADEERGV